MKLISVTYSVKTLPQGNCRYQKKWRISTSHRQDFQGVIHRLQRLRRMSFALGSIQDWSILSLLWGSSRSELTASQYAQLWV